MVHLLNLWMVLTLSLLLSCQRAEKLNHEYPLGQNLEFGEYAVGFKVFHEPDFSRGIFPESGSKQKGINAMGARRVSFGLWYPAKSQNTGKHLKYFDYMKVCYGPNVDSLRKSYLEQPIFLGDADTNILVKTTNMLTLAEHNAQPLSDAFPLIIYAGKPNDLIPGNSVLFEYLASHGYVVLSIPPKLTEVTLEALSLNNFEDMSFAINHIKSMLPTLDISRIATVGYEIGGISTVAMAIRHPDVKAHLSINGAVGSWFGWQFAKPIHYNNLQDLKVPILHIGTGGYDQPSTSSLGEAYFETVDSIPNSKRYFSYLENSVPLGVSSHLILSWILPLKSVKEKYHVDKKNIVQGYESMLETSLLFFDTYLKNEKQVGAFDQYILSKDERNFIKPANITSK